MDTLILNADGLPVSVLPLSTIDWQESIKYMVLEKADVLLFHENWIVRSARWETPVPSVIMLKDYLKGKTTVRFSRANLYLRDNGHCQYCNEPVDRKAATIDHVVPSSKGGKTTWDNCVIACGPCNSMKSDHTHYRPKIKPYKPDYYELVNKRKRLGFDVRFEEWLQFIN